MRRSARYALFMLTFILLACLVSPPSTDSAAPEAVGTPEETHEIVPCAAYDHVFLAGHKGLEMAMVDYGDREGVVGVTPRGDGFWDFACPDVPTVLHVFWLD